MHRRLWALARFSRCSTFNENGHYDMNFSLRTLLIMMLILGSAPLWSQYFLIPFFVLLVICIGMSVVAFGDGVRDRDNFH